VYKNLNISYGIRTTFKSTEVPRQRIMWNDITHFCAVIVQLTDSFVDRVILYSFGNSLAVLLASWLMEQYTFFII
jgi:ABC-type uncharacterized transport system fused permease/ATPase subunit